MKEARLIFPEVLSNIRSHWKAIAKVNNTFNGSTIYKALGYWKDQDEDVWVVDIAYEPSLENDVKLYDIAQYFRASANQESVYLRYGNGNVQFVTEKSCMDNGEHEPFEWERLRDDIHRPPDDETDIVEHAEHVALI